jgi:hypothetical protein
VDDDGVRWLDTGTSAHYEMHLVSTGKCVPAFEEMLRSDAQAVLAAKSKAVYDYSHNRRPPPCAPRSSRGPPGVRSTVAKYIEPRSLYDTGTVTTANVSIFRSSLVGV